MRYLNELEEAVGSLLAISVCKNSLLVSMDSFEFTIDFPSTHFLEQARRRLSQHVGKKIGVFRDADAAKPLRIRLATPRSEVRMADWEP